MGVECNFIGGYLSLKGWWVCFAFPCGPLLSKPRQTAEKVKNRRSVNVSIKSDGIRRDRQEFTKASGLHPLLLWRHQTRCFP